MCEATKGNGNDEDSLFYAYTNSACNWSTTLYQTLPYDLPGPAFVKLIRLGSTHGPPRPFAYMAPWN